MKIPFTEYQRRSILLIAGLVLAAYYFVVLLPLSRHADSLEEPVHNAWKKLCLTLDQTNSSAIDFLHITNQLSETKAASQILDRAKKEATARLQLDPALRAKVNAPEFEFNLYDRELNQQRDALANLAKQAQVTVGPAVLTNYPDYSGDVLQANLLWATLAFTDSLLRSAVACKVSALQALEVPPVLTNRPAPSTERLVEIPLHLEFTSSAANAEKLLQSLPLRGDEARAAGLTNAPDNKPVLFIDGLVIKKQSPDKLDEVHVWLRALGFVLRE